MCRKQAPVKLTLDAAEHTFPFLPLPLLPFYIFPFSPFPYFTFLCSPYCLLFFTLFHFPLPPFKPFPFSVFPILHFRTFSLCFLSLFSSFPTSQFSSLFLFHLSSFSIFPLKKSTTPSRTISTLCQSVSFVLQLISHKNCHQYKAMLNHNGKLFNAPKS